MRLQKYLASCGVASRRSAEKLITEGRISVNGRIVTELGTQVDGLTDVVYSFVSEKLMNLRSFFGRGDGRFGCYEADGDNKNLYSEYKGKRYSENIGFADFTGSCAYSVAGTFTNSSTTMTGVLFENDDLAYDYSLFGMRVNGEYRIYSGVRWSDENINGDGDHVMLSTSADGVNWRRYIDAPMFYLGRELAQNA